MTYNRIGDDGMSSVPDGLQHNNTITRLDVSLCGSSKKGSYHNIANYRVANYGPELNMIYLF